MTKYNSSKGAPVSCCSSLNKYSLFTALVLLSLLSAGCPKVPNPFGGKKKDGGNPLEGAATVQTFHQGQQAYMDGEYNTASRKMGVYAESYPNTVRGIEARYWQGMSLLELGQARRARSMLEKVENNSNSPKSLKALSLRGIARSYEAEQNYLKAENYYNNLLMKYREDCDSAEVLSSLAGCAKARGDHAGMTRYVTELKRKHPKSPYLAKLKPAKAAQPRTGSSGIFRVQAGVFSSRDRALSLLEKLHIKRIDAVVIHKGGRFIVQAGSFSTRQRAEQQAAKIKRLGFNAIVK
ncbi:MAG: SPOR domain-containing protein [Planctomycetota bacterium]|jgi:TolA-binding protein